LVYFYPVLSIGSLPPHYFVMPQQLCYSVDVEISILIEGEFTGCPDEKWFRKIAKKVLASEDTDEDVELSLVITSQEKVHELNRIYRGKDRTTDVLAFYMTTPEGGAGFPTPPDGTRHLGEVVISYPQTVIQAGEQGHSIKKELAILTLHGVLHLLGYDHEKPEERRRMRAREAVILKGLEDEIDD